MESLGMGLKTFLEKQGLRDWGRRDWCAFDDSVHFYFDAPGGVEERGDDNHGGCGTVGRKEFAVNAPDGFPVFSVGEIHARADYVVEGRASFRKRFGGDGEDAAGLSGCVFGFCAYWASAG
jgi:hypothetical protein